MTDDFVAYVGGEDIQDGTIVAASQAGSDFIVDVAALNKRVKRLCFVEVHEVHAVRPVGMLIYALIERKTDPPWRRFVFGNWVEKDDAALAILAKDLRVGPAA